MTTKIEHAFVAYNWLVRVHHDVVPTEDVVVRARRRLELLALGIDGEYHGWEAELVPAE